jgi:hypothetical protein
LPTFVDRGTPPRYKNWARQNPPFLRLKRRRARAAIRFSRHDPEFVHVDLDAQGERAQIVAAVAATVASAALLFCCLRQT